jgi:hypothetical protein
MPFLRGESTAVHAFITVAQQRALQFGEEITEKLAIALGRPLEEATGWSAGRELIDDHVVMKAPAPPCIAASPSSRGLARGFDNLRTRKLTFYCLETTYE